MIISYIETMIRQCVIIFGCLAIGELIVAVTGIKLPASIIGMLCVAADITLDTEFILSKPVSYWKTHIPDIQKRPAIFMIGKV